jgi:hypothetical protein
MSHVRKQLREAIAALVTGLSTTGSRVFQSRVYPLQESELPALLVSTESEANEYLTVHKPRMQKKTISVLIKAVAKAVSDFDDTLDEMCREVEEALATNQSIGGLAKALRLTGTNIALDGNGEQPVGVASISFDIEIFCFENTPDVAIT